MAEEGKETIKKKLSEGAVDALDRVNNWVRFGARRATFDYLRFKQVKTSVQPPIERRLRKKTGIVPIFNSHIEKLDKIESSWTELQKLWVKLMNYYVGMGLKRSAEYTAQEISMCKFGSRVSEKEIKKEFESMLEGGEETIAKGKPKLSESEKNRLINDISEEGLTEKQIKEKREMLKRLICPLDNPDFVDWHEIKLNVYGEEVSEIYPLPKEVRLKTWFSLIDDGNFDLDSYTARFFGFEKYGDWSNTFEIVTRRICGRVMEKLRKSDKFQKIVEKKGKGPTYVEDSIKNVIVKAFVSLLIDKILPVVLNFENELYPFLRRRTQQFAGKISAMDNEIDALRPSLRANIHFERTYMIVDPNRVVRARVYHNGYLLHRELVHLNNSLEPKDRINLELTGDEIKLLESCGENAFIPTKQGAMKGPSFHYLEYKYKKDYNFCLNLEIKLQRKFEDINHQLRNKNIKGYYLTWGMMGVSFDGRGGHPDERAPGLDENGWPFEVEEDGTICLDKWERRAIRKVPREFVTEMDLLLKTNIMNNEYDAVRDDLRDGRYHMDSLTIFEYVLAEMAKWGPESSKLTIKEKEFKSRLRYEWMLSDKSAEYVMDMHGGEHQAHGKRAPTDLSPAFDLRAIKNKNVMKHWVHLGRKRYYDTADAILNQLSDEDMKDPTILKIIGPTMSTRGVSMYLIEQIVSNVADFEEAGKILEGLADKWYDYGPRGFNKPGPKNPLRINIQTLNESLEPSTTLKLFSGITSTEDKIEPVSEG